MIEIFSSKDQPDWAGQRRALNAHNGNGVSKYVSMVEDFNKALAFVGAEMIVSDASYESGVTKYLDTVDHRDQRTMVQGIRKHIKAEGVSLACSHRAYVDSDGGLHTTITIRRVGAVGRSAQAA